MTRTYDLDERLVRLSAGPLGVWAITAPGSGPLTGPKGRRRLVRIDNPAPREGPTPNLTCDGALAVGTRWLWLSDICARSVTRLNPRNGATVRIDVGGEPWSIALGAGAAWISTGVGLQRIAVDSAEATLVSPRNNSVATYSDGRVWFLDCWGCERASLRTIDISDGSEIMPRIRVSP